MRTLPWLDAWHARLDVILDPPDASWAPTVDGWIPARAVAFARAWNRPADASGSGAAPPLALDFERDPHPYGVILAVHEALAARGIELVVAPVPTRLQVYPDFVFREPPQELAAAPLCADFGGLGIGSTALLEALDAAGVHVVDLLEPLARRRFDSDVPEGHSDQAFLRYNMHWTPHAAQLAAQEVARRVRALEAFVETAPDTLVEERDFVRRSRSITWAPRRSARQPHDTVPEALWIEELGKLPGGESAGDEPGRGAEDVALQPLESRAEASPIMLWSDSYGTHFSDSGGSFGEHLAAELGQPLDHISIAGGGVLQPRLSAARRREHGVATKRIVVWLFSVVMYVDEPSWRAVDLFGE